MRNRNLMQLLLIFGVMMIIFILSNSQNKNYHPYVNIEIVNVNKNEGKFIVSNMANKKVFYGRSHELYKRNFIGVWERVNPFSNSSSFLDIQELQAKEKKELIIPWETAYGELKEGAYKFVKEFDEKEASVMFRIE